MKYKITIVDDEPLGITVLEHYLADDKKFEVSAAFTDPEEAFSFLIQNPVDVLLLDINMPFLNGFELFNKIEKKPLVIIITAHDQYLQKGFDTGVIDYLQKPVKKERLYQALDKVKKELRHIQLENEYNEVKDDEQLYLKTATKEFYINKNEVLFVKGLKDYCSIQLSNGNKIVVLGSLKTFLENYNGINWLVRVHKSYAVATKKISEINKTHQICIQEYTIPIGRKFRDEFLRQFRTMPKDTIK